GGSAPGASAGPGVGAAASHSRRLGGPDAYGPAAQAWAPAPPQPSGRSGGTRAPAAGRGEDSAGAPPAPPAPPSPPRSARAGEPRPAHLATPGSDRLGRA